MSQTRGEEAATAEPVRCQEESSHREAHWSTAAAAAAAAASVVDRACSRRQPRILTAFYLMLQVALTMALECHALDASVGIMVPLRWGGEGSPMQARHMRYAASAAMAAYHINHRVATLVPRAAELLPANFNIVLDIQDSMALPSKAVKHVVTWQEEGRHAIIGSYRSAVTGPLALTASIDGTPVIAYGATASTLSDRDTYPTLGRTIVSDAVLAEKTTRAISAMGWTRIAVVYVNDAWGRGFSQELFTAAPSAGVEIVLAAAFALGGESEIDNAVRQLAQSGARVIISLAFDSDIEALTSSADRNGMLGTGYTWITVTAIAVEAVIATSANPQKTRQLLTGWLDSRLDLMSGGRGDKFQTQLESEPLEHLDHSALEGHLSEAVITGGRCDQYCATMYDAVWTAAIAMSKMDLGDDGSVDKVALLSAIRNVSFEGASGRVWFDEVGERDASEAPMMILTNLQPTTGSDGEVSLSTVPTWRFTGGVLERESSDPPIWPGGERGWELPVQVLECGDGEVFSRSSLQCEPCPRGTAAEGNECVRYDASVGVMVPLRWGGEGSPMSPYHLRHAAAATMAAYHINERVATLVPRAAELLPANFKLVFDLQDSMATPSVAVRHVVKWQEEGRHAIVGSYRSAVTGPLALAASIDDTPVIAWGATASGLSDRDGYPTLGRTSFTDDVWAGHLTRAVSSMGWTQVALLYVNDAWGRDLAQDMAAAAQIAGVEILVAAQFALGERSQIQLAISRLEESGARIIICFAFNSDIAQIAQIADTAGMLDAGFAWVTTNDFALDTVLSASEDPEKTKEQLAGWIVAGLDALAGDRGPRFWDVMDNTPLQHLDHDVLDGALSEEVLAGAACDHYCAMMYDAFWTVAIAMSMVGGGDDGSVDKAALLSAIRGVSFEGASGHVAFNEAGERDAAGQPLVLMNLRPGARRDGGQALTAVVTWTWWPAAGGGGSLERESSDAPYWPGGGSTWTTPHDGVSCQDGFIFSVAAKTCEPCPRGTRLLDRRCVPCEPGSYGPDLASVQCSRCQVGYANESGMAICHACPQNTRRPPSSLGESVLECECLNGYYAKHGPGKRCEVCPAGAVCPGGNSTPPYPQWGFYGDKECVMTASCDGWDRFYQCNPELNCEGGANFSCVGGREGRKCQKPAGGYSVIGGLWTWECGKYGSVYTVLGIVAVVLAWAFINHVASGRYDAINIALLFVQIVSMIGNFGLKWSSQLDMLNILLQIANFDVDFVTPLCIFHWTDVHSFYLQLLLPFLFGIVYSAYHITIAGLYRRGAEPLSVVLDRAWRRVKKKVCSLLIVVYTSACIKCFSAFRCEAFPGGRQFLFFMPEVECWTTQHIVMVVVAAIYIPSVLIGIPCAMTWNVLRHQRDGTLHDKDVVKNWAFVHGAFENKYKWWELVLEFRRFSIAVILTMFAEPMMQGAAAIVVLCGLLAAHVFTRPYIAESIDVLDFVCLAGAMLYALCGLLMYPRVTLNAQGLLCSGGDQGEVSEFCAGEEAFKSGVSMFALVTVTLTVLVSGHLTLGFVRELRASHKARRAILSHLSLDSPSREESSSPVAMQSWGSARRLGSSSKALGQGPSSGSSSRRLLGSSPSRKLPGATRSLKSGQSGASWGTALEEVELAGLDSMLHGPTLLRWAQHTSNDDAMGSSRVLQSSPEAYVAVEEDLSQIQLDLSQYSSSTTAVVLRHLVELPGLLDYLMWISTEEATALAGFIERLSTFLAHQPDVHPVHSLVVFEHRATIGFWLTNTSFEGRATFRQLVEAMAHSSGATTHQPPAWFKPEFPPESPLGSPLGSAESDSTGRNGVQGERGKTNTNKYARSTSTLWAKMLKPDSVFPPEPSLDFPRGKTNRNKYARSTSALWAKMPTDSSAARIKEKRRSLALQADAAQASLHFTSDRPVVSAVSCFSEDPAAPAAGIEWPQEKAGQLERHTEESRPGTNVPMSGADGITTRPFSSPPAAVAQTSPPVPALLAVAPSDAPSAPASVPWAPSGPKGNTTRPPPDSQLAYVKLEQEPADLTQVEESEAKEIALV